MTDRPLKWILYWHGSGPQRGTHVMELTDSDLTYSREIAYLGPGGEQTQTDGLHDQAEKMVDEHNRIVDQLRELTGTVRPYDRPQHNPSN